MIDQMKFLFIAAACTMTLCGAVQPSALPDPFFVFEDGMRPMAPDDQAILAKEIGFDGISFDGTKLLAERLKALDSRGLQMFYLYLGVDVGNSQITYEPGLEDAIVALRGRSTIVWLTVRGSGNGVEERAVEAVRRVSDIAAASNLRVALYPHYGLYVQTMKDALHVASEARRSNVGVTFNLCHELRSGLPGDLKQYLETGMPRLWGVSMNGADSNGRDWDHLIQPLDKGTYDVANLLRILNELGYRGPIGLQCYGIKEDHKAHLTRSMAAWRLLQQ